MKQQGMASVAGDEPRPMTTMFVGKALATDEVVQDFDKRYVVLSKLARHNGYPKTAQATTLVRRAR